MAGGAARTRIRIAVLGALVAVLWAGIDHVLPEGGRLDEQNICRDVAPAALFAAADDNYKRRYDTIAHRFLDAEAELRVVEPWMYAIVDQLIAEAQATLRPIPAGLSPDEAEKFAAQTMRRIDCILLRHGFVYPAAGGSDLFSDGLIPAVFEDPEALAALRKDNANTRRARFIAAHRTGPFYLADCDIGSYVFLAIAEVMNYPIRLIEIPEHAFVRWEIAPGRFVNFETVYGAVTRDDHYLREGPIPDGYFDEAEGALRALDTGETFSLHDELVAASWLERGEFGPFAKAAERSISRAGRRGVLTPAQAYNAVAWYYAAAPDKALRNGAKAVRYAEVSIARGREAYNVDTLACALAEAGDFERARSIAAEAVDLAAHEAAAEADEGADADEGGAEIRANAELIRRGQSCSDPQLAGRHAIRTGSAAASGK